MANQNKTKQKDVLKFLHRNRRWAFGSKFNAWVDELGLRGSQVLGLFTARRLSLYVV